MLLLRRIIIYRYLYSSLSFVFFDKKKQERLAIVRARRELEEEKCRGLCPRCSRLSLAKETVSNGTCKFACYIKGEL